MTVQELIDKLRKVPKHARVTLYDREQGEFVEAVCVTLIPDDPAIFHETALIEIHTVEQDDAI